MEKVHTMLFWVEVGKEGGAITSGISRNRKNWLLSHNAGKMVFDEHAINVFEKQTIIGWKIYILIYRSKDLSHLEILTVCSPVWWAGERKVTHLVPWVWWFWFAGIICLWVCTGRGAWPGLAVLAAGEISKRKMINNQWAHFSYLDGGKC